MDENPKRQRTESRKADPKRSPRPSYLEKKAQSAALFEAHDQKMNEMDEDEGDKRHKRKHVLNIITRDAKCP